MSKTTKNPIKLAKLALEAGNKALDKYSHRNSPKKFTQPQLFAVIVIQQFYRLDYRGVIGLLEEFGELRKVIGLKTLPNFSTLCYAEQRIFKKKELCDFLWQHLNLQKYAA